MGVFKEIERADGSGVTTFYRISDVQDTVETDDSEGTATVIDYNQAQNKPSINGVALVGNKTSEDLGLQPAGDYITNDEADAKFIDEDELEAYNYVNETQLQEAIANIDHFHREIVAALPVTGQDNVLYLVRKEGSGEDIYNEYIWVGRSYSEDGYEFIGTTATDLTDYYQKSEVNALLNNKVDKVDGKGLSEQNYTLSEKTKLAGLHNYDDTELQVKVANLHNYDDTDLQLRVGDLEVKEEADINAIQTIQDALDKKMICIRLVEQGDGWTWMDINGSRLTFDRAQAYLGQENCMLFVEQLENDGKVIPAEYKSETTRIRVLFKDLDSLVHILTLGEEDLLVEDTISTEDGLADFEVENEAVDFGARLDEFYGNTSQEVIAAEVGTEVVDKSVSINDVDTTKENYITLKGDTSQANYTGKNKIGIFSPQGYTYSNGLPYGTNSNIVVDSYSLNEMSFHINANSYLQIKLQTIQLEPNTEYIISYNRTNTLTGNSPIARRWLYNVSDDNSYSIIYAQNSGDQGDMSYTFTTGPTGKLAVAFGYNNSASGSSSTIKNLMIRPSSIVNTDFEPYCGGTPSPNPDYPQNIHTVSGDNDIVVCGKNLFDKTTIIEGKYIDASGNFVNDSGNFIGDIISIDSTKSYYVSASTTQPKRIAYYDSSQIFISRELFSALGGALTIPNNAKYLRLSCYNQDLDTLQLELGNQATTYEAYQGQTYPIYLGVENLWQNQLAGFLPLSGSYPQENQSYPYSKYVIIPLLKGQSISIRIDSDYYAGRIRYIDKYTNQVVGSVGAGSNDGYCNSSAVYSDRIQNGTITALKDILLGVMDYSFTSSSTSSLKITYGATLQYITSTPIELYKIGDYQDKIYKKENKWYIEKQIGKAVLNGTENWSKINLAFQRSDVFPSDGNIYGASANAYSDHFIYHYYPSGITSQIQEGEFGWNSSKLLTIRNDDCADAAAFKSWLANNNVSIYYMLTTPVSSEITNSTLISQLDALYNATLYPMTNISTDANDLLPYIDLKYNVITPAPSPDRPSEIKVVKGNNNIKTVGKNRLNVSRIYTINGGGVNVQSIIQDIKPGSYVLSCANVTKGGTNYPSLRINNDFYRLNPNTNSNIIIPDNVTSAYFYSNGTSYVDSVGVTSTVENLMISPDGGDYELYKSQTFPLSLGQIELCKIGNYKDKIYKQDGKWYLHKETGKAILDGTESYTQGTKSGYDYYLYTSNTGKFPNYARIDGNTVLFDKFKGANNAAGTASVYPQGNNVCCFRQNSGDTINAFYITSYIDSPANLKEYLTNNNAIGYYVLATSTEIEITDPTLLTQLENLQQITQYKHTYIDLIPVTDNEMPDAQFTYISNAVINASDRVLGKDTYWNNEVPTSADLPSNAQEGEIRIVQDTQNVYIYDGYEWIPFDKGGEVDLSNYLAKDNSTAWVPTGAFNPATKKYVDDSVNGIFVPTKTSQLTNDSNFIGVNSNNLTYYYTKSQTYNKSEVDALIHGGGGGGSSDVQITVSGDTLVITTQPVD